MSPLDKVEKNRQWAIDNNETWALSNTYCRLCKRPYDTNDTQIVSIKRSDSSIERTR